MNKRRPSNNFNNTFTEIINDETSTLIKLSQGYIVSEIQWLENNKLLVTYTKTKVMLKEAKKYI